MEPPGPSFADRFNVPQKYAVLVVYIRQTVVSLPFQVHRPYMLVEAGGIAFSNGCFEFSDEGLEEAQHGRLASLPKLFASHFHGRSKPAVVGFCA